LYFKASSSEFDEYLREDGKTNRLEESCKVFETLLNYKYLKNVEFILFLNKHDLLKEKIKTINIKNYCRDFKGNPSSLADVENYLIKKFTVFQTNQFNRNELSFNNDKYVNANRNISNNNNNKSANSYNKYKDLDSINMIVDNTNNSNSYNRQDKSIYSHFTTAIDTNNIKTIFEMVRLMIFEKNCKAIMLN